MNQYIEKILKLMNRSINTAQYRHNKPMRDFIHIIVYIRRTMCFLCSVKSKATVVYSCIEMHTIPFRLKPLL